MGEVMPFGTDRNKHNTQGQIGKYVLRTTQGGTCIPAWHAEGHTALHMPGESLSREV